VPADQVKTVVFTDPALKDNNLEPFIITTGQSIHNFGEGSLVLLPVIKLPEHISGETFYVF
jgi:hypothetical protein